MGLFLMYFCLFGYFFLYKRTYSYMDEFIRISYKYGVDVNNKFIKNISNGLSVFEFLNDINILDEKSIEIKILSNDIEKHENDIIATGDSLVIYQNGIMKDLYKLSVIGDASGDGIVNSLDLILLRKHIVGYVDSITGVKEVQTGVNMLSVDINDDRNINSLDLVLMRKIIVDLREFISIKLSESKIELIQGDKYNLDFYGIPNNVDNTQVTWSSSDSGVVIVDDDGMLTAVGDGKATITIKSSNGVSSSCEVIVRKKIYSVIEADVDVLRDPFVLVEDGVYYMYGTGWRAYKNESGSLDGEWKYLENVVQTPSNVAGDKWAPEVYKYNGAYYMFTTYKSSITNHRGTSVFRADSPEGPFVEISNGHVTPAEWDSIDGTLYIDNDGQPWMVFVHEWTSTSDSVGRMAVAKLSNDLTKFISTPIELFKATDASWSGYTITDGCFMYTTSDGQLLMLWSNIDKSNGYAVGIARSNDGAVTGKWSHDNDLLYSKNTFGNYDGGHGMIFKDIDGQMYLSIHSPNAVIGSRKEKPIFIPIYEENGTLKVIK